MKRILLAACLSGTAAAMLGATAWSENPDDDAASSNAPRVLRSIAADELASNPSMMQRKLDSSGLILNGLVTEDFELIDQAADDLLTVAFLPDVHDSDEPGDDKVYEHFRNEFRRLAAELKQKASERNLEGAAYLHSNLTANCIACHQHLRDTNSGIELLGGESPIIR